jgi:hypothetical protein
VKDLDYMLRKQLRALILQSVHGVSEVGRINLKAYAVPSPSAGSDIRCTSAHKWIKYRVSNEAKHADEP